MQWADFVKAVNNIEVLANINGVGKLQALIAFPASIFFIRKHFVYTTLPSICMKFKLTVECVD